MLDRSQQPPLKTLEEYSIQHPVCRMLPNGVKLYLLDAGDTEVTRVNMVFNAGKFHQDYLLQSLFTNRMLREGTRRFSRADIAEKLDFYGAWMDLSVSYNHSFVTLYSLNKSLPQTLDLLEEMIKEPVFDQGVLEVVKSNNLQKHLVSLQQTAVQARRLFQRTVYGLEHPLGQIAEASDFQRVDRDMLLDYFKRFYHSGNLSVYLTGRITEDCLKKVEALFGHPFGNVNEVSRDVNRPVAPLPVVHQFMEMKDSVQSSVCIGKSTVSLHHPDIVRLRVLLTLLGGYFGSRLMSTVREEKGYTYGIYAILNPTPIDNTLMIISDCDHKFVKPLLEEVYLQIERLKEEAVSEEELSLVKNSMKGEILRTYESRLSLSDAWIFVHTMGLPDSYFHDYWQGVSETTIEDLQRLASVFLCKESLTEVVVGQKMS